MWYEVLGPECYFTRTTMLELGPTKLHAYFIALCLTSSEVYILV